MAEQTYQTHRQFVPGYHYVLFGLLTLGAIGACVNLVVSIKRGQPLYDPALILLLFVCGILTALYARVFALKAQDRLIRLEERLRHQALTGQPLDSRLRTGQIIGLRFASDEEFPALAARAAAEGLSQGDIKRAIKTWRPDTYRV